MKPETETKTETLMRAMCEVSGYDINTLIEPEARAVGEGLRDILVCDPDCTAKKIHRAAERFQRDSPETRITPRGLAAGWRRQVVLNSSDFTIKEAAVAAECSPRTIRRAIQRGEIDAIYRNQRVVRIPFDEFLRYTAGRRKPPVGRKCPFHLVEEGADAEGNPSA